MARKKPVIKMTELEWEAHKKYCVVMTVQSRSEKRPFMRVFGPYDTRQDANNSKNRIKTKLTKQLDPMADWPIAAFGLKVIQLWDDLIVSNDIEIVKVKDEHATG